MRHATKIDMSSIKQCYSNHTALPSNTFQHKHKQQPK